MRKRNVQITVYGRHIATVARPGNQLGLASRSSKNSFVLLFTHIYVLVPFCANVSSALYSLCSVRFQWRLHTKNLTYSIGAIMVINAKIPMAFIERIQNVGIYFTAD